MLLCASSYTSQRPQPSASSLHWLPGGGSRWPSTLHKLSAFHQVIAKPTASSRHLILGNRQPRTRTPPASARPDSWSGTKNALLGCEGIAAITRSQCHCARLRHGGEGCEGHRCFKCSMVRLLMSAGLCCWEAIGMVFW